VSNDWTAWWVYWVGPIAGALLGALAYQLVRAGQKR
jgi:glycerol uptake facilitator-like aquaporin